MQEVDEWGLLTGREGESVCVPVDHAPLPSGAWRRTALWWDMAVVSHAHQRCGPQADIRVSSLFASVCLRGLCGQV